MTPRIRTALISAALGIGAFVAVYVVGTSLRGTSSVKVADSTEDALSVEDALDHPSGDRVAVRGFVFLDVDAGQLLCSRRTTEEPISCTGQSMQLVNLDSTRLDLDVAPTGADGYDAWTKDPVTFVGTVASGSLTIQDLVGS